MIIVGIDPGIAGAICFFSKGNVIDVIDMPTMAEGKKNKKQVNGRQIFNEIKSIKNKFSNESLCVVVEQVSAMPGQGVTSMFNFGQSFGLIKGICSAMELPIFYVRPAKWKKYFNLINSEKDASRTKAIEIFPKISHKLSRKKDNNKADAILIAQYFENTRENNDN
tara:strand:- start:69 stop:566 length:498 start_codon:yes stop_codon:yes gene_type:complete